MARQSSHQRTLTFLNLPAEIRNAIYELHCHSHTPDMQITLCHVKGGTDFPLPITRVSQQIRRETLSMCWSIPPFASDLYYRDDVRTCKKWINIVSEEALASIRFFRFYGNAWAFAADLNGKDRMQASHHSSPKERRTERLFGEALRSLNIASGKHGMTKKKLAEIIDILAQTGSSFS